MTGIEMITAVASVPAILALVNLYKQFGVTGKWSALAAVLTGIVLYTLDGVLAGNAIWGFVSNGMLAGLAAAGVHDIAKLAAPKIEAPQVTVESPRRLVVDPAVGDDPPE